MLSSPFSPHHEKALQKWVNRAVEDVELLVAIAVNMHLGSSGYVVGLPLLKPEAALELGSHLRTDPLFRICTAYLQTRGRG